MDNCRAANFTIKSHIIKKFSKFSNHSGSLGMATKYFNFYITIISSFVMWYVITVELGNCCNTTINLWRLSPISIHGYFQINHSSQRQKICKWRNRLQSWLLEEKRWLWTRKLRFSGLASFVVWGTGKIAASIEKLTDTALMVY